MAAASKAGAMKAAGLSETAASVSLISAEFWAIYSDCVLPKAVPLGRTAAILDYNGCQGNKLKALYAGA